VAETEKEVCFEVIFDSRNILMPPSEDDLFSPSPLIFVLPSLINAVLLARKRERES
jgi:hypothetical protein